MTPSLKRKEFQCVHDQVKRYPGETGRSQQEALQNNKHADVGFGHTADTDDREVNV